MSTEDIRAEQVSEITAFVDTAAPPPEGLPTAHFIFGTNQMKPAEITAERYHRGLAPLIITTGGVNRHNGIIEGQEFRQALVALGVPDEVIHVEERSANTWQNVEFSIGLLSEALAAGLPITAVCKWYHRRAVHFLKTLMPEAVPFYVITWEPVYDGWLVTRAEWPGIPSGRRRVVREWDEVTRRLSDGSLANATRASGAWQ